MSDPPERPGDPDEIELHDEVRARFQARSRRNKFETFPQITTAVLAFVGTITVTVSDFVGDQATSSGGITSTILIVLTAAMGVAAVVISVLIVRLESGGEEVYTSFTQIEDDNLRELIIKIAQAENALDQVLGPGREEGGGA